MNYIKLYHFFAWSNSYGWQHLGSTDGYETLEECEKDNQLTIETRDKCKVMKLEFEKDFPESEENEK